MEAILLDFDMTLEKSWRWFGDSDSISLAMLRQMDVAGVVTSLYEVPAGNAWTSEQVSAQHQKIQSHGMRWNVVESLPVAEGIKTHSAEYDQLIQNYIQSMKALSENGIDRICYNFMPVLDWARTDLNFQMPNGSVSMQFDYELFAAFDVFMLKRPGAERDYSRDVLAKAEQVFGQMSREQVDQITYNIIVVTQSFIHGNVGDSQNYIGHFLNLLDKYADIGKDQLRQNLKSFLDDILPYAEKYEIKMAIHPDDPPFPLLGLPRIVSTSEDFEWMFNTCKSDMNGMTFCSGSLSIGEEDVCEMAERFTDTIHFAHLRNNEVTSYRTFHESGHYDGKVDMVNLVSIILREQKRRADNDMNSVIPIRPDHGLCLLGDDQSKHNPGYPLYGRMKGLAEISGIEAAILDKGII